MTGFYQWTTLLSIYLAENALTYYILFLFLRNNLIL